ncbi:NmrA family transcriptional regulator [Streptomyces albus subsp. chlorinus]|uniref:NAD(P)H-binding protein n=1 Tax=Streptomyces albus TaxID=1888 RepID=UPI001570F203|nr:NAD(P)H-binding protein [Streptomyces albus]NSC21620.1 NmrA family transcriptional regulator [Streptomyces albus subsp. chlorinus]
MTHTSQRTAENTAEQSTTAHSATTHETAALSSTAHSTTAQSSSAHSTAARGAGAPQPSNAPVLVLCGTGKNGRRVAARLREKGHPVRVGTRSGTPPFDWESPGTWDGALDGVGAVFVVCQPDVGAPGTAEAVRAFSRRAAEKGVRRLVLLSARGEDAAEATERAVREAGTEWTILRTSWFFQNFSEGVFLPQVLEGELPFPAGDVREPFIDAGDIAEVAAAALTEDGHHGRVHDLTGPRLLTFGEAVAEVAAASGRQVRYLPLGPEEYGAWLAGQGLPADLVAFLGGLFGQLLDGRNAAVSDGVREVLGRPPRDFTDFAREAAAEGAWNG